MDVNAGRNCRYKPERALSVIDVYLPSESAGSPSGNVAVRLRPPEKGSIRYLEGAPIVICGVWGYQADGLINNKPKQKLHS
jgi:hypothetical protein